MERNKTSSISNSQLALQNYSTSPTDKENTPHNNSDLSEACKRWKRAGYAIIALNRLRKPHVVTITGSVNHPIQAFTPPITP